MQWNVYMEDFNGSKIVVFNVFDHCSFSNEVQKLLVSQADFEIFSDKLKTEAMYYFWSKCEYEVVVTSWPPHISAAELDRINEDRKKKEYVSFGVNLSVGSKIDIYSQLRLNWDAFAKYVWEHKA